MCSRVFVKALRPAKNINTVKGGLYYIGRDSPDVKRSPDLQNQYFGRLNDREDVKRFLYRIKNHRALKHPLSVKTHHLVFSLRKMDYEAYKRSGRDYKEIVRAILKDYEGKHGVKLDWIAHIHDGEKSNAHPHCHVIIKAVSDNLGDRGYKRVFFKAEDFKQFRESFDLELDRHAQYRLYEREEVRELSENFGKSFKTVMDSIAFEAKQKKHEQEFERGKIKKKKRGLER